MARLVVVSNRVAPVGEGKSTAGGLAVAMLAALRKSGGIWFGWSGEVLAKPANRPNLFQIGRLTYATVDLTQRDYDEYYNGYANSTLWPLFHYRLDLTEFSRRNYAGYLRVNRLFAELLMPMLHPNDLIWVHDYHLIPLADELRRLGARQLIGFFLHTPFPALDALLALPNHENLVRSLCAYDVVGFQTDNDLRAFHDYIVREARGRLIGGRTFVAFGRNFCADAFPIGLDTDNVVRLADRAEASRQTQRLRESLQDRHLIIGVDRLDYSKGLVTRFEAFAQLLESHPELRGRVVFMQIAPPSRIDVLDYLEIRRTLEATAGRINGRFAEYDWAPIRYLNKSFSRPALTGFLRISQVGLVTPLRDGMNLVAKEYVAAQRPDNPGALVLSRFAGAARELDQALIVNPYDVEAIAEAMHVALVMPQQERRRRWTAMMKVLRGNDIAAWRDRFVGTLEQSRAAA
jgi:trehalose 6-phosphate synthase